MDLRIFTTDLSVIESLRTEEVPPPWMVELAEAVRDKERALYVTWDEMIGDHLAQKAIRYILTSHAPLKVFRDQKTFSEAYFDELVPFKVEDMSPAETLTHSPS